MFDTPLEILMTTTAARPRKAAPRSHGGPLFKPAAEPPEALIPEPANDRPTHHNGVLIVNEQVLQNLPKAPFKISRLKLADGGIAFACRECLFTADTRGQAMGHRMQDHGIKLGGRPARVPQALASTPDPVLPPRADGSAAPTDPLQMTLGEYMALAPSIAAMGDLIDRVETERDEALELLGDRRLNQHKLDSWDEMRDELTVVRQQLKQREDYDQVRAEMMGLRNWKRKMIKRLSDLGFQLNEEDQ